MAPKVCHDLCEIISTPPPQLHCRTAFHIYILVHTKSKLPPTMDSQATITPSLDTVRDILAQSKASPHPPNLVPITASVPADLLTPTLAYLKIAAK